MQPVLLYPRRSRFAPMCRCIVLKRTLLTSIEVDTYNLSKYRPFVKDNTFKS
jgi:hypothetical protein